MYSYISPEARVRADHPLRAIRAMADTALKNMSEKFDALYARTGRPSIAPEKLLRAQLIQLLYSVRSERLLMEEHVAVVPGTAFGPSGAGHVRCCYATAVTALQEALTRIERFVRRQESSARVTGVGNPLAR